MIRTPFISVMTDAALKAAKSLRRDLGEVEALQVSMSGPGDCVSAADRRAEKIIREALTKARPTYGLVMEESGVIEGSDGAHRWHVDPLDGTKLLVDSRDVICGNETMHSELGALIKSASA